MSPPGPGGGIGQTRGAQNAVAFGPCGFESHPGYPAAAATAAHVFPAPARAVHDVSDHHHPRLDLPESGRGLDLVALSATLHCLTGCAIGEVAGMVIGTALGLSDWATVGLSVALAFAFG